MKINALLFIDTILMMGSIALLPTQVHAETTYVLSDELAKECPTGSVPLETLEECQAAYDALGYDGGFQTGEMVFDGELSTNCFSKDDYFIQWLTGTNAAPDYFHKIVCKIVSTNSSGEDPPATTNSGGDPHFIGFVGKTITYQGECTLLLLESPSVTASGDDVIVHVRTTRKLDFSYISGVAMKIGEDVIEVTPKANLIFNGQVMEGQDGKMTMSGLPFAMTKEVKGSKNMIVSYSFDLGNGRIINVQANKKRSMMFVKTMGQFPKETKGMLGSPGSDEILTRDGRKLGDVDVNVYGESWQVKDTDEQLFQEALGPQYPQKCLYEDAPGATAQQLRGRRKLLVKKIVSLEEARAGCLQGC